jgi:threonine aldolase
MSTPVKYHFASDNCAGICPEAWEALQRANTGFEVGYGDDQYTKRATDLLREIFEIDCEIFFTFNGTAANSLALAHMCQSYHSVICHERAHVETDECGGPEFFSNGTKILLIGGEHGRVDPQAVENMVKRRNDIHFPKPNVLSLTQSTELGTVYQKHHLDALLETTRRLKLKVHMDGARFANAIASLKLPPKEVTWKVGVDVLCFGGTKNGLPISEAVIFFNKSLAAEFDFRCKQAGQLASKMRFLAAPWVGILESGAWLKHAAHANQCAKQLEQELKTIPGVQILSIVEANGVFVQLAPEVIEKLRQQNWRFYMFIGNGGARFMCSWDTKQEDILSLVADIRTAYASLAK